MMHDSDVDTMLDTSSIGNYQCTICMCNYLCKSHLMEHMLHHDSDDDSDIEEKVAYGNAHDVDSVDYKMLAKRTLITTNKRRQTVKPAVTVPYNGKPAMAYPAPVKPAVTGPTCKPAVTSSAHKPVTSSNIKSAMTSSAHKPAVTSSAYEPSVTSSTCMSAVTSSAYKLAVTSSAYKPAVTSSVYKLAVNSSTVKPAMTSSAHIKPAMVSPANPALVTPPSPGMSSPNIKPADTGPVSMKSAMSCPASVKAAVMSVPSFRPASSGHPRSALDSLNVRPAVTSPDCNRTTMINGSARTEMVAPSPRLVTAPTHSYSNGVVSPIPSPQRSPDSVPPSLFPDKGGAKPKVQKRSIEAVCDIATNPRLTLTIKKSRASYEVYRDQDPVMAVSPASQMREENCDVQSDSANETIDVESSSPEHYCSPGSQKYKPRTVNGRRKSTEKFVCETCEKHYKSRYALKRHIATHRPERPFVCEFPNCDGAFKLKSRLSDHKRYVHKIKTPRTTGRSKSVSSPSVTSQVQPVLNSSFSFPGSGTSTPKPRLPGAVPSNVNDTAKSQPSTKEFKCTVPNCTRYFSSPTNLAIHLSMHTGLSSIGCFMCPFTAHSSNPLIEHFKNMHGLHVLS